MKFFGTPILVAGVVGLVSQALACDFGATLNSFQYCAGNLKDGGKEVCRYNGYGDNTGYCKFSRVTSSMTSLCVAKLIPVSL